MKKSIVVFLMAAMAVTGIASIAFADDVTPKKTAAVLNRLIEVNLDGELGFKEAAEHATSASLKAHFLKKAEERAAFAAGLKGKVVSLGQEAEKTGSVAEAARRAWIDVKTAVTSNDDKAVLEVVRSQQAKAIAEYRRALRKALPEDVRKDIADQSEKVQDCYDWIQDQLLEENVEQQKKDDANKIA